MILAAGRGERMRPISDHIAKPLLPVAGKPLIVHQLLKLSAFGIKDIVINLSYQAEQIKKFLGSGEDYGVKIHYSIEPVALETGGGIYQALPLLGQEPFIVISSDIYTDFPLQNFSKKLDGLAHLLLVKNPSYHPRGDFNLENGKINLQGEKQFTFASMGVYHPDLFKDCQPGGFRLTEVLFPAIERGEVTGEVYRGQWANIGSIEEWQKLL